MIASVENPFPHEVLTMRLPSASPVFSQREDEKKKKKKKKKKKEKHVI